MARNRKSIIAFLLCFSVLTFVFSGCSTHMHTVGNGGKGQGVVEERQWYAIWGLVPINQVDTDKMAGGSSDYTVQTQTAPLDILFNIVTQWVTVSSRTVTVTK